MPEPLINGPELAIADAVISASFLGPIPGVGTKPICFIFSLIL